MIDDGERDVATLIVEAKAGDRSAFGELYGRYARMVHGVALTRLRRHEADDLVQEAFVRALHQLHTLRDVGAFGGWLASIARHLIVDTLRRRHASVDGVDEPRAEDNQHDTYEAQRALDAIRSLPEAYRDTVMMRLVEGMTGPEIADRTGLTPASVRVNLHRGIKLLRTRLAGEGSSS